MTKLLTNDYLYTRDANIKVGSIVRITGDCYYNSRGRILPWMKEYSWYVKSIQGKKVYLGTDLSEKYYIKNPIHIQDLALYE